MIATFVLRPVATTLLALALAVLGVLGYQSLPAAALPSIDLPTVEVVTRFPGASPAVVETSVTAPLEHGLGQMSGLRRMTSRSSFGFSLITLQFDLTRTAAAAAQDVQAAIDAASGWIPSELLPGPPTYRRVNPAEVPVVSLAVTSDSLKLHEVNDLVTTLMLPKLSQIAGVGTVDVEGGQQRAIRVQANAKRLAALGLSLEDLRRAIAATTTDVPKGTLDGVRQSFNIAANDQLLVAASYAQAVVAFRDGAPILLPDVAQALDGVENAELAAWSGQQPAVILNVQRQPGANAIGVADAVEMLLPSMRAVLPQSVRIEVLADRTGPIRAAIAEVRTSLAIAVGLVVAVIYLFLWQVRATVIAGVTVSLSVVATFAGMAAMGYTIDTLSLMALTIASGFLVDDAIVVIENVARHIELGRPPLAAAVEGTRRIAFTVVSLTVSLVAVFIPLLLMGGAIGRLFQEFAVVLAMAVVASAILSLTLTPMMCGQLLGAAAPRRFRHPAARRPWQRLHEQVLDAAIGHPRATVAATVLAAGATLWLYAAMPRSFLPEQDSGLVMVTTEAEADSAFAAMAARHQALAAALTRVPEVRHMSSVVGIGPSNATLATGRLLLDIGLPSGREVAGASVLARLRAAAASVPGIDAKFRFVQDLTLDTEASRSPYSLTLQDLDPVELATWSHRLAGTIGQLREVRDAHLDPGEDTMQRVLSLNRQAAAARGVTSNDLSQTLYDAFGQRQIATVNAPNLQYRVVLELSAGERAEADVLERLRVTPASATDANRRAELEGVGPGFRSAQPAVPLSAIATIRSDWQPPLLLHSGLFPATTISFDVAAGESLGTALAAIKRAAAQMAMPEGVTLLLNGMAAEFDGSRTGQTLLILAAALSVYIVLGVLYESFVHPLVILATLPTAGMGALLALLATGRSLDLLGLIGIVLLIGIVKKNAIMIVDFALGAERQEGLPPREAVRRACLIRTRPIMMTTVAAVLGTLPLLLSGGTGEELRRPLGIVIISGLLVSQFFTLYATPALYLALCRPIRGGQVGTVPPHAAA